MKSTKCKAQSSRKTPTTQAPTSGPQPSARGAFGSEPGIQSFIQGPGRGIFFLNSRAGFMNEAGVKLQRFCLSMVAALVLV